MEWTDVKARVRCAFNALEHQDLHLLENDAHERTICARLADHLRSVFPGYHVDVEYNRHCMDPKTIEVNPERDEQFVYPDVIVHHRGNDDSNLLVMELKKSTNPESRDPDRRKLNHLVEQYGYKFAVLVDLPIGGDLITTPRPWPVCRIHPSSPRAT
ncbi:MAG: hypothetical protein OXH04_15015 [Acidobacteria bacterium]|nr:hypothetical protein [Acidobacteriota bacterium]